MSVWPEGDDDHETIARLGHHEERIPAMNPMWRIFFCSLRPLSPRRRRLGFGRCNCPALGQSGHRFSCHADDRGRSRWGCGVLCRNAHPDRVRRRDAMSCGGRFPPDRRLGPGGEQGGGSLALLRTCWTHPAAFHHAFLGPGSLRRISRSGAGVDQQSRTDRR